MAISGAVWVAIGVLEVARKKLRALVKLIEKSKKNVVYIDFEDELEFINLLVEYLAENGVMAPARLYESPFTDISQQGPEALFPPGRVTEMVRVLDAIRERAVA